MWLVVPWLVARGLWLVPWLPESRLVEQTSTPPENSEVIHIQLLQTNFFSLNRALNIHACIHGMMRGYATVASKAPSRLQRRGKSLLSLDHVSDESTFGHSKLTCA
jgi:hypothetical protein